MEISYKISNNHYSLLLDGKEYLIKYTKKFGLDKNILNETNIKNVAFAMSWPFSFEEKIKYNFGRVFFKDLILKTCLSDLPTIAEERKIKTQEFMDKFGNAKNNILFENFDENSQVFPENFSESKKACLLMSFGKDSLLSFGLAKEIGLEVSLIFNGDMPEDYEFKKKKDIAEKFNKDFNLNYYELFDDTDKIIINNTPKYFLDFISSITLLHYTLLSMPIIHKEKAGSIIVGNEQNFNDTFLNSDGVKAYVSSDQTREFMKGANEALSTYTNENLRMISLIEPVYNIFEMSILHGRYKGLLKYMMSCSSNDIKDGFWCYKCPMCAKSFLYTKAFGYNPKVINFKKDLFGKDSIKLYPLFSKPTRTYEKPPRVREEQLLAFYLAYKKGATGYLIDKFKRGFLKEAKEKYEGLHKIFFGIHPSISMPPKIKQQVISIYKEELNNLNI